MRPEAEAKWAGTLNMPNITSTNKRGIRPTKKDPTRLPPMGVNSCTKSPTVSDAGGELGICALM